MYFTSRQFLTGSWWKCPVRVLSLLTMWMTADRFKQILQILMLLWLFVGSLSSKFICVEILLHVLKFYCSHGYFTSRWTWSINTVAVLTCLSVCPPGFTHKTRVLQCENLAIFNEVSKPRRWCYLSSVAVSHSDQSEHRAGRWRHPYYQSVPLASTRCCCHETVLKLMGETSLHEHKIHEVFTHVQIHDLLMSVWSLQMCPFR